MSRFLLLLALLFSAPVFASGTVYGGYVQDFQTGTYVRQSASESCQAFVSAFGYIYVSTTPATYPPAVSGVCYYKTNAQDTGHSSAINIHFSTIACPANSTGTTVCTCTDPYFPSADGKSCIQCPAAGTTAATGFVDMGTVWAGTMAPPQVSCNAGCSTNWQGGNAQHRQLIGGVYHYLALGSYVNYGTACAAGTASQSTVATSLPAASCAAGQISITSVSGTLNCYNDMGASGVVAASPLSASAVQAAATAKAADTAAKAAAAGQSAADAVAAAGGDAVAQTNARYAAAAAVAGSAQAAPPVDNFCTLHPNDKTCNPAPPCDITTDASCLGTASAPETIAKSTPDFLSSVTPVAFSSAAGCPAPIIFQMYGARSISFQPMCDVATYLRPLFLALASITAAFIFAGVMI